MSITNLVKLGSTISSLYEVEAYTLKIFSNFETHRGTLFAQTLQEQALLLNELKSDIDLEIDGYCLCTDACTEYRRRMRNLANFKNLIGEIYAKRGQSTMHHARRLCREYEGVAGATFIKLAHTLLQISNKIAEASTDLFVTVLVESYKEVAQELNDMAKFLRGTKFGPAPEKVIRVYARLMDKQAEYLGKEVGTFYKGNTSFTIDTHREQLLAVSRSMSTDVEDQLVLS